MNRLMHQAISMQLGDGKSYNNAQLQNIFITLSAIIIEKPSARILANFILS